MPHVLAVEDSRWCLIYRHRSDGLLSRTVRVLCGCMQQTNPVTFKVKRSRPVCVCTGVCWRVITAYILSVFRLEQVVTPRYQ